MKWFSFFALFLLVIFFKAASAAPTILLNTTGQPPLNTSLQNGFMDEVAAEAFRRVGFKLNTVRLPAERGLKNSNLGLIDGEMSRVKGLEKVYVNLIRVPEKIMDWEFVAFSHKQINLSKGWEDLSGKLVSHINGWKILEKNIPVSAEVTKTTNADELFNLLAKHRTDFALYELWGGRVKLQEMMLTEIKLCKPPLAVKEMFIYLHKKHRLLVPKLATALTAMKKDGSYLKIVNKHLAPLVR